MRAKPISFAQVLKIKNKQQPTLDSQSPSLQGLSLAQMVEQFEESPEEDYTLYLAPVSRAKPSSFRAIASKTSNHDGMFDSWIQRQSLVSNKENVRKNPPSQFREREEKKIMGSSSQNQKEREPLRSVADLVRKIELTQSQDPYFKSNSRPTLEKTRNNHQQQSQRMVNLRVPSRQNQQTSLRSSSQTDHNQPVQIRLPEKIHFQPYIQQPTAAKQPRRREDISDIIAGTERIHLEIAQLAHKMMDDEEHQRKEMEESLLLDNHDHRENGKETSPSFLHTDQEKDLRWLSAKNQVDSYLRKITQEAPKQQTSIPKIEIIPPQPTYTRIQEHLDHPGYSFATKLVQPHSEDYAIPLEAITIPKIQQIQSERLPFEHYKHYTPQHAFPQEQTPIPQNNCIPATKSINYQASPEQVERDTRSPQFQMSAKRIGSSLVFSSNRKDTPSPQGEKHQGNSSNSGQQHVTLSFTEEKPEIVIKIPLDYAEGEEFQMETVEVRPEYVQTPFVESNSPQRNDWQNVNNTKGEGMQEEERILHEQPQMQCHNFYAKGAQEYITAEENNDQANQELKAYEDSKEQANSYELQRKSYEQERNRENALLMEASNTVPLTIYEGSLPKMTLGEQPLNKIYQTSSNSSPSVPIISPDHLQKSLPSQPPTQPLTEDIFPSIKSNKSSGCKGSSKGSPSIFGLKKIYSSPKTIPVISQPPVVTSVFTTALEKPKAQSSFQIKPLYAKPYERTSKIEPLAYGAFSYNKVTVREEPKVTIEEENEQFKFDF